MHTEFLTDCRFHVHGYYKRQIHQSPDDDDDDDDDEPHLRITQYSLLTECHSKLYLQWLVRELNTLPTCWIPRWRSGTLFFFFVVAIQKKKLL